MNWIQRIRECFKAGAIFYSRHAKYEMENEEFGKIFDKEVSEAIYKGEVIEEYPEDKPYPSVLIYGRTTAGRPLHIVCAYDQGENLVVVITVYHPNPELWVEYKRRINL